MRRLAQRVKELTRSQWLLRQSFLRKCARVRGLSERLKENAARGDARAIIEDVIECERSGKFKQKRALLHFVRDMLHSLRLSGVARQARGMRWHKSSKRIFAVLRKFGGARTQRFLHETLQAPHHRTVEREWAKDKMHFKPGANKEIFERIGLFYRDAKARLGITGIVLYEVSEDETTVPGASEYNQYCDSIVGFCGRKGPNHECDDCLGDDSPHCIVIGEGDDAYDIIERSWSENQLAGYLRCALNQLECTDVPTLSNALNPHTERVLLESAGS